MNLSKTPFKSSAVLSQPPTYAEIYARLAASPAFNPEWYTAQHPRVLPTGGTGLGSNFLSRIHRRLQNSLAAILGRKTDPVSDYARRVSDTSVDPGPLFSSGWYIAQWAPESPALNPLFHYLTTGAALGLDPHPLFDTKFYLARNADVARENINPLEHFLTSGAAEGRYPSALFDPLWYATEEAKIPRGGPNPLVHYVTEGARSGLRPHPLFDPAFYLEANPDVAAAGHNPLVHFILSGAGEGRWPNAFFDTAWYAARAGIDPKVTNPLRHYIESGEANGIMPSEKFDPVWYATKYPDIARGRTNLLRHFLLHGLAEGRTPFRNSASGLPDVAEAEMYCAKVPRSSGEVALLVTHSPDGTLKPHVRHYINRLRENDVQVVLIVAADAPFTACETDLLNALEGLFVRENVGFDFAAWAHVLKDQPQLFDCETLYLLNDSLLGPSSDAKFASLLDRVRKNAADIVGLTENQEYGWHIQSYFVALKKKALSKVPLHLFFNTIRSLKRKDDVIKAYELTFAPRMREAGLRCEVLFPNPATFSNRTIFDWKALFAEGFPFIKIMTVRDSFPGVDASDWREVLSTDGYDLTLTDKVLIGKGTSKTETANTKATENRAPALLAEDLRVSLPPKVALIGPWNYSNGLAVACRGYASALRLTGLRANYHPVKRPFHVHKLVSPPVDVTDFVGNPDVVIVNLNPDGWPGLLNDQQQELIRRARFRIGAWVWELKEVPDFWYPAFDQVDLIWAPSQYCADIYRTRAKVPVEVVPYPVNAMPAPVSRTQVAALRAELGLSAENRVILYAFDGSSYLVRKNPFALVSAFSQSGLAAKGWRLILKTKHIHDSVAAGERLQGMAEATGGVILIDKPMSNSAMETLLSMADIYASPHCAEGFGLTIAEAMAARKIVVATDYSGSRDFLDPQCGFPVPFTLAALDADHGHYGKGGIWASIDTEALETALCKAAREVEAGSTHLGAAAQQKIANVLSLQTVSNAMRSSIAGLIDRS